MAVGDVKLGLLGQETALPAYGRQLSINVIELSKTGVTASGLDVEDIIGYKREFSISYEVLIGADCEKIVNLYELHQDLNLMITNRNGTVSQSLVKLEPIPLLRESVQDVWYWANPVLKMRERRCSK